MIGWVSLLSGLFSTNTDAADYKVAETYSGLRSMVFGTRPEGIGIKVKHPGEVWGVLMETGYPEAVATLLALADGTVSLYFSNGGAIVGVGPHPGPQRAAQSFLSAAQQYTRQSQPTKSYPLPKRSFTRFYLFTGAGVLTTEAKEDDLGYGRHFFSPLFHKGHELVTEIMKVDERLRAEQGAPPDAAKAPPR